MSINILFSPFTLPNGLKLKNRIVKAAMTEGLSIDGKPNDRLMNLYESWAKGGASLLISGNVMVDRNYLERPGNIVIDETSDVSALKKWADMVRKNDCKLILQISHPGRQCTRWVNKEPLAPSAVELDLLSMFKKPRALEEFEILDIIQKYAKAAEIADRCGFDGVQIHGAHGYLISQFLSPITNLRNDQWGGSLENRARFLIQIIKAVRSRVKDSFMVSLKLNSSDFQKGGYSLEDCMEVVKYLNDERIDMLELSGGTYEQPQLLGHHGDSSQSVIPKRQSTVLREAYFAEYAKQVRTISKMPLMVTGGFEHTAVMNEALKEVDLIGVARPFCVQADWPNLLQSGTITSLPRMENQIVGKGKLGPASPYKLIQVINIQGEIAWFYYQILQLSDKKPVKLKKKLITALLFHLIRDQWLASKRRALLRKDKK